MTDQVYDDLRAEVEDIIEEYENRRVDLSQEDKQLSRGKLFEFFALGKTLENLRSRGYTITLQGGGVLDLKQGPGKIQPGETHFEATFRGTRLCVYTDIEVVTLGSTITKTKGLCSYHEIDIVVVECGIIGRPRYDDLYLGVECKSHPVITKNIVKEVLGIKREISYFSQVKRQARMPARPSYPSVMVNSNPSLEYWLAHMDPTASRYAQSPGAFGIEFKLWAP